MKWRCTYSCPAWSWSVQCCIVGWRQVLPLWVCMHQIAMMVSEQIKPQWIVKKKKNKVSKQETSAKSKRYVNPFHVGWINILYSAKIERALDHAQPRAVIESNFQNLVCKAVFQKVKKYKFNNSMQWSTEYSALKNVVLKPRYLFIIYYVTSFS